MTVVAEVSFKGKRSFVNELRTYLIKEVKKKITESLNRYGSKFSDKNSGGTSKNDLIETIRRDIVNEYVLALTRYEYSESVERKDMTELLMRAMGRNPREEGSFHENDAEKWADNSTSISLQTRVKKRTERQQDREWRKGRLKSGIYVNTIYFKILVEVINKILVSIETGQVSWHGDSKTISNFIKRIAQIGLIKGRIVKEEAERLYHYATLSYSFAGETYKRGYLSSAVWYAFEKHADKWASLLKEDLQKDLSRIKFPTTQITINKKEVRW